MYDIALIVIINECCEIRREIFKLHIVQWVWGPHFSFVCCRVVAQRAVAEETGVLKLAELSIILQWDQNHFEVAFESSYFSDYVHEMFSVLDGLNVLKNALSIERRLKLP